MIVVICLKISIFAEAFTSDEGATYVALVL